MALIFHCLGVPHFVYSFISSWVFEWFSPFWLLCYCEHSSIIFVWTYAFTLLAIYLDMELLELMVTQSLTFWGTSQLFSKVIASFYIPPAMYIGSSFSTSSSTLVFFNFSHEVLSHCHFNLYFPNFLMILSIFSCAYFQLVCHLWELSKSIGFSWVVFLMLSCKSSLYILAYQIGFEKFFSRSVGFFFTWRCPL